MKRLWIIAFLTVFCRETIASSLFQIESSGVSANYTIILCLDGIEQNSCEKHQVQGLNLKISPSIPNRVYLNIGLKIDTSGFFIETPQVCKSYTKNFCLFSASQLQPQQFSFSVLPTVLTVTPHSLALSVTGLNTQEGIQQSGKARSFLIKNTGLYPAVGIACPTNTSPSLSSITCLNCNTLNPSQTCQVTLTPTNIPSANVGDTEPEPISLTLQGMNSNPLSLIAEVLTYGSYYQSGFIFSILENSNTFQSIGGTVIATEDSTGYRTGLAWDSNTGCNEILGNCVITNANRNYDGSNIQHPIPGNTFTIIEKFDELTPPLSLSSYAAGICANQPPINGYGQWYLPAICELGFGVNTPEIQCGTRNHPAIPNIQSNLVDPGLADFNLTLPGNYWSSTEFKISPQYYAWYQYLSPNQNSYSDVNAKFGQLGVRCARALTIN